MTLIKTNRKPLWRFILFLAAGGMILGAVSAPCGTVREALPGSHLRSGSENGGAPEQQLLDAIFRIDIQTIRVTYDYVPASSYVDGRAEVVFQMRGGQNRPVIHFDPAVRGNVPGIIRLNGELLDFSDPSDVRVLDVEGSTQSALEFQRDLAAGADHTLEMVYRLHLPEEYPRFSVEVNDLEGRGNEEIFPTINTPHELARHYLTFRVHGSTPFNCIGSGLVEAVDSPTVPGVQEWRLDTEREVASYTVMFVLMPAADVLLRQRRINGVDVRVMAFVGGPSIDDAFAALETWLPQLEADLGPFPMPRGLSIFLTRFSGGMEYYGATITSPGALEHEVFHMYFGCSVVADTYRDSWWDEGLDEWYEHSLDPGFPAIYASYRGNMVSGRSPVAVGFDRRAYDEGSRVFQAVAEELGGRQGMMGFLRFLCENYSFAPFSTMELLDYLEDYAGVDMGSRFLDWLYAGENTATYTTASASRSPGKKVDLTPPEEILEKYRRRNREESKGGE